MAELIEVPLIGTYPKVPATPYEMNRRYSAIIENLNRLNAGKQESGSFLTTAAAAAAYLTLSAAGTTYAPLASPEFSGAPKVPTATPGTNTTQAASTAFIQAAISAAAAGYAPSSALASRPGHTYTENDWAWLDKPGGLIMQWGRASIAGGTPTTITFPVSFTAQVFPVLMQRRNGNNSQVAIDVWGATLTNFVADNSIAEVTPISYIAIGY